MIWPFKRSDPLVGSSNDAEYWRRSLNDAIAIRTKTYDFFNRELYEALIGAKSYSLKILSDILEQHKEQYLKHVVKQTRDAVKALRNGTQVSSHPNHARIDALLADVINALGAPELNSSLAYAISKVFITHREGSMSSHDIKYWLQKEWESIEPYVENVVRASTNAFGAFSS